MLDSTMYATSKPASYFERYNDAFSSIQNKSITLLELGVQKGGSLQYWADFFPKGTIVGIDTRPKVVDLFTEDDRIHVLQGRQEDTDFLDTVAKQYAPSGFDIIIDDASHIGELTAKSFWHLFTHHLQPGGLYIIEDWGTGYWEHRPDGQKYEGANHSAGMVGFIKELIDELGADSITHSKFGTGKPRKSRIQSMNIYGGMVFLTKK
jgi:cephalosporin hydroxylase